MISVCLASFNGEKYIENQLNSILPQLGVDDEVIISDDGSTDNTIRLITQLRDDRISLIHHDKPRGLIFNFENALKCARGDIIFLSDQDDLWNENKVQICLKKLERADIVLSDCEVIDDNIEQIYPSFFAINHSKEGLINNLIKNSYIGCCMAFKRDVLRVILPFPPKIPMHDIWIGFVGELLYKVEFIHTPLVKYRRHNQNASITAGKSHFGIMKKISFRLNTIRYIFGAYYRFLKNA